MTDATPNPLGFGEVDQLQAGEFAEAMLNPDLTERCLALSAEFDQRHDAIADLFQRFAAVTEAVADRGEDCCFQKGHRILRGIDTDMSYETLERAEALFQHWTGMTALWARAARLVSILGAFDVDEARMQRDLADAAG